MKAILCGYGAVGRTVAETFDMYGIEYVVVEKDRSVKGEMGVTILYGDAKREDVLREAGIDDADVLIACTGSDAENAFIILAAQDINPEIKILSRAEKLESVDKLYMAGADYVVSLANIAGKNLARLALMPYISGMKDWVTITKEIGLMQVEIPMGSDLMGRTVGRCGARERGISIVGIKRGDALIPNPKSDAPLLENDVLILAGDPEMIKEFASMVKGEIAKEHAGRS